jgi:excisionase family DNA binding protein
VTDKKPKSRRPGGKTNDCLDALTRAQIELTERMNTLTRDVAAMGMRQDQMAMVTNEQIRALAEQIMVTNEQIRALVEQIAALSSAHTRTDEEMRMLVGGAPRLQAEPGADAELPDRPKAQEIAAWLRVHVQTVYNWAHAGEIPCVRRGRTFIFDKAALVEWARNSTQLGA